MSAIDRVLEFGVATREAFEEGQLIRLRLAGYEGVEADLKSIDVRFVVIKGQDKASTITHYRTRDITKNHDLDAFMAWLLPALQQEFRAATLNTVSFDLVLERHGEKVKLRRSEVAGRDAPPMQHDRIKNRPLSDTNKPYLHALGITGKNGQVRNDAQDKFRQINKMVEIFAPLIQVLKAENPRIVDMGAGKGYLDFALYDYLANVADRPAEIIGVEMRDKLVADGNATAAASGLDGLSFVSGTILDYDATGADAVIALHACDTATDDAIFKGIDAGASLIAVAPCCHKQIRRQMEAGKPADQLDVLLRHGIFLERQAEMVTDTLRALLLELSGYRVKVFEFVSDAHTPKNNLIVAEKDGRVGRDRDAILKQIAETKAMFGVDRHYLEGLLGV